MNENPQEFKNVKVYSSDPWVEAADALYKNLCFENIETESVNTGEFYMLTEGDGILILT